MDFVRRVELHEADAPEYESLGRAMMAANFATEIVSGNGVPYRMPKAPYFSQSFTMSARDVGDLAMRAASTTGLRHLTTSGEIAFFLRPTR